MGTMLDRFESTPGGGSRTSRWVERGKALEAFGVTYMHAGDWTRPIVEVIGSHGIDTMPDFRGRFFTTQSEAVSYVRRLAREAAEDETVRAESFLSSRSVRLLRTFGWVRNVRYSAPYLVLKMTEERLKKARRILETDFSPTVQKLPARLRFPTVVSMDEPVFVVDYSRFIASPVLIREERIVARMAIPTRGGDFDAVVRYRVSSIPNFLSYDHPDETSDRLSKLPSGVVVFLYREAAERFVMQVMDRIKRSVDATAEQLRLGSSDVGSPVLVEHKAA